MNRVFCFLKNEKYAIYRKIIFYVWIIVCAFMAVYFNFHGEFDKTYSYVRIDLLNAYIKQIKEGVMPQFLSAPEHSYGFVFYIPYISAWVGQNDASITLYFIHGLLGFFVFLLFPILIYKIVNMMDVAVISQVLLFIFCGNALIGYKVDQIFAAGLAYAVCVPLILIYHKHNKFSNKIIMAFLIGFICSMANIFRNQNGFAVLVLFLIVLIVESVEACNKNIEHFFSQGVILLFFTISYNLLSVYIPLFVGAANGLEILDNGSFLFHLIGNCALAAQP